jgi:NO-binding membrane sensor protein with MHYT domain
MGHTRSTLSGGPPAGRKVICVAMISVLGCIVFEHNIWLVIAAAVICGTGSWVATRLFQRAIGSVGAQRAGWYFLTALTAGVAIWCTHFVAMLGFRAGVPVSFDPLLTTISLLVAVAGATLGFAVAGTTHVRGLAAIGGALVGLAIVVMHYTGMMAYRVQGVVSWDPHYLVASIVLAVVLAAAALHASRLPTHHAGNFMAGLLALAIVGLHFTGMTAFHIEPLLVDGSFSNPEALTGLALAVTGVAAVIVAAGLTSFLIDDSVRAESHERLRKLALHDSLTGLSNRTGFSEHLDREIQLAHETAGKLALVALDLNRFKEINDLRGHGAGDDVL